MIHRSAISGKETRPKLLKKREKSFFMPFNIKKEMLCKYPKEKKADSARTWKTRRNMAKTN
jgi:gas vesicle protein